jgi:hypothetical protein
MDEQNLAWTRTGLAGAPVDLPIADEEDGS